MNASFQSFGEIPRSKIAGSGSESVLSLGRDCQAVCPLSICTICLPTVITVSSTSFHGHGVGILVALHAGELRSSPPYTGAPLWESVAHHFCLGVGAGGGEVSPTPISALSGCTGWLQRSWGGWRSVPLGSHPSRPSCDCSPGHGQFSDWSRFRHPCPAGLPTGAGGGEAGGGPEEEITLLWLGRVFLIFHLQMKTIGPSEASRQGCLRAAQMGWPLLRCTL